MFTKFFGCVATLAVSALPAFAQEVEEVVSFDGVVLATGYTLPKLGVDISSDPNISASGSLSVSDWLDVVVWGSSDLPINDDGENQGLEIDLLGVANFGSLDVTFGTYLYPEVDESDLVLGFALEVEGFVFEANRYEGFSDTTSIGVMAPAMDVGYAKLSLGVFHNITPFEEYQSLPVQLIFPLGDFELGFTGYIRSDDEKGGAISLALPQ